MGQPPPDDNLTDFRPKIPRLYPGAHEFQELPSGDKALLAEFYDATSAIDDTITAWSQSSMTLDFNAYNVLMQHVQHTVELGIMASKVFCPERLFSPTVPILGTVVERSAKVVSHAKQALHAHLQRWQAR